jgi:hypothetical protein
MTPLFRKKPVSRERILESVTAENPIQHIPAVPFYDPDRSMGHGFNIVKMIEEHAPQRLAAIEDDILKLERQMDDLHTEKARLTRLMLAIQ